MTETTSRLCMADQISRHNSCFWFWETRQHLAVAVLAGQRATGVGVAPSTGRLKCWSLLTGTDDLYRNRCLLKDETNFEIRITWQILQLWVTLRRWRAQFARVSTGLSCAVAKEAELLPGHKKSSSGCKASEMTNVFWAAWVKPQ